jgi:hypothetical protein
MLYGVTRTGMSAWGITREKDDAICCALKWNETHSRDERAEVWAHTDVPEISAWDWPTFRTGATRIYPISE